MNEAVKRERAAQSGYGLSYTTFAYSDLEVSPKRGSGEQGLQVAVTVQNTGNRDGKEVVELYLSKRDASVTPPLRRLKRFAKVDLQPGGEQRVSFELTPEGLSFIAPDNRRIREPGEFDVEVGGLTQSFEWRAQEALSRDKRKIPRLRDKVSHLSSQVLDFAFGHPLKRLCCDLHRLLVGKA